MKKSILLSAVALIVSAGAFSTAASAITLTPNTHQFWFNTEVEEQCTFVVENNKNTGALIIHGEGDTPTPPTDFAEISAVTNNGDFVWIDAYIHDHDERLSPAYVAFTDYSLHVVGDSTAYNLNNGDNPQIKIKANDTTHQLFLSGDSKQNLVPAGTYSVGVEVGISCIEPK